MNVKKITDEYFSDIKVIYKEQDWNAYLNNDSKLINAIKNSNLLGLFHEEKLVGFIRYLTDSEHILYIQDLIIAKKFRRKGGGEALIDAVINKYPHVRSKVLITDIKDQISNSFYQKLNFKQLKDREMVSYIK